jgi:hypothetical protein
MLRIVGSKNFAFSNSDMAILQVLHIEERIRTLIKHLIKLTSAAKLSDVIQLQLAPHPIDIIHTERRSALYKKKCYPFDWFML